MTANEGLGLWVTPELVQSTSTGLLCLLGAGWLLYGLCRMERAALWPAVAAWGRIGRVETAWTGWRVQGPHGYVVVVATLLDTTTHVCCTDGRRYAFDGVPAARIVRQLICSSRAD
jgi:hypothetical protein